MNVQFFLYLVILNSILNLIDVSLTMENDTFFGNMRTDTFFFILTSGITSESLAPYLRVTLYTQLLKNVSYFLVILTQDGLSTSRIP